MYEEAVARGCAFLDQHKPGWDKLIDVAHIAMHSCYDCVAGQTFGYYEDVIYRAFPSRRRGDWYSEEEIQWAINHGFYLDETGEREPWDRLGEAWARAIIARRAEEVARG